MPQSADNFKDDKGLSIMSRGTSGSGKTTASCGKEFRPVYVFDTDQRMASVINYYRKLDGHCKDVYYDSFAMGQDFKELDQQMDRIMARPEYKTVVFATLTSYVHIVLAHVLKFKSGKQKGKSIAGIQVTDIEDYSAEDAAIIFELCGFLKNLQSQGVNVILEAHLTPIEYRQLDGTTRTVLETLVKGKKGPASIPGYFDEVYYFQKKYEGVIIGQQKVSYIMSPVGDSYVEAKTSRNIVPIEWTNKDFSVEFMKQIRK